MYQNDLQLNLATAEDRGRRLGKNEGKRHTVICGPNGKIMLDGIVLRRAQDEFHAMCFLDPHMLNSIAGNKFHLSHPFRSWRSGCKNMAHGRYE